MTGSSRHTSIWSEDSHGVVIDMFNNGKTCREIVYELSTRFSMIVTRSAVSAKVSRLRKEGALIDRPIQNPVRRLTIDEKRERSSQRVKADRKPPKERSIVFLRATTVPSMKDVLPSIGSLMIAFADLQQHQCHFPTGAAWCGHGVAVNSRSYCEMHQQRVYVRKA